MQDFRPIHRSGYARADHDFYPTPDWVTEALLKHMRLRGPVWEPCCGDGAMAEVLLRGGYEVLASDITDRGFGQAGVDIFSCDRPPGACQSVVTNPPYGDGGVMQRASNASLGMLRFVRHALAVTERVNGQLALLVRFQWLAGKRASTLITEAPLDQIIVLTKRICWFDHGPNTTTGQHHHAWVCFDFQKDPAKPPGIVFTA